MLPYFTEHLKHDRRHVNGKRGKSLARSVNENVRKREANTERNNLANFQKIIIKKSGDRQVVF